MVYQDVTRSKKLPPAAKGLYAYLASFCGEKDECYPTVKTITGEMQMGKDAFYKHINILVEAGVIEKKQTVGPDGKFGKVIYKVIHTVNILDLPCTEKPNTDVPYTDAPNTATKETNNNNIINNNNNKNNITHSIIHNGVIHNDGVIHSTPEGIAEYKVKEKELMKLLGKE